ncbi:MAG: Gfo/Idh/MocA family protein [Granulosicoccus sp.]
MLDILIVGTGRMAATHAERYAEIEGVRVLAAVDVDKTRAQAFSLEHDIPHAYDDLQTALSQYQFAACSVVTPDAWHASVSIACLDAGLPVLCEKPLSDSLEQADAMVSAAQRSGQMTMVNLSYRTSGALHTARQFVDGGKLGDIRHVEASYRQSWLASDYWGDWRTEDAWLWRLSTSHGSLGVLGDVGIHILDFLCAGVGQEIAGLQCRLQTFNKAPDNRIGEYELDANDSCVMNVELGNGALGVVHMSRYYTGYMNDLVLTIHGTEGAVTVSTGQNGDSLRVCLGDDMHTQTWALIPCKDQPDTFARFVDALHSGTCPTPDFAHASKLQTYLSLGFDSHETGQWVDCDL